MVENIGLGRAVIAIALGISTSSLALGSWTVLKKIAKERIAESRRVVASVEEALSPEAPPPEAPPPKDGVKDPVEPSVDPDEPTAH